MSFQLEREKAPVQNSKKNVQGTSGSGVSKSTNQSSPAQSNTLVSFKQIHADYLEMNLTES